MIAFSPRLWRASAHGARKEPNMRETANQQINNIQIDARVLERGLKKYHKRLFLEWGNDAVSRGKPFSGAYAGLIQINDDSTQACSTSNKKGFFFAL